MAATKRKKASPDRDAAAGGVVAALEAPVAPPPAFDDLDDILGELAGPATETGSGVDFVLGKVAGPAKVEPVDDLDDILGEIAGPAKTEPSDDLDDILGEISGPAPEPVDDLDDILGEIAGPAKVAAAADLDDILSEVAGPPKVEAGDDLDDILGEIAGPAKVDPIDDLDDILSEVAAPAKAETDAGLDDILSEIAPSAPAEVAKAGKKASPKRAAPAPEPEAEIDDLSDMLSELAAAAPNEEPKASVAETKKSRAKGGKFLGALRPNLRGKREVSRKAYFGMKCAIGVLTLAVVGEAAVIVLRPAHAPARGHGHEPAPAVTVVPVDYSKVDLKRYVGKVRSLPEGGRDMLRHAKVKAAILDLDSGETLYKDLRKLAAHSPAADLMTIRDNRVTIVSCNGGVCGDKSFRLVYDIPGERAAVCVTEKYINGSFLSYSYSEEGYSERPRC